MADGMARRLESHLMLDENHEAGLVPHRTQTLIVEAAAYIRRLEGRLARVNLTLSSAQSDIVGCLALTEPIEKPDDQK